MEEKEDEITLVLPEALPEDSGDYTVKISSPAGDTEATVSLTVDSMYLGLVLKIINLF